MDVPRPTVAPPGRLVRLGVVLDTRNPIERLLEVARMCDRAGIGALWVEDVPEDPWAGADAGAPGAGAGSGSGAARVDAWTALARLAGEVRRARIGAVLDVAAWAPARLARMAATLGVLTGGRLELTLRAAAPTAGAAVLAFREALAATTVPAMLTPAAGSVAAGPAVMLAAGGLGPGAVVQPAEPPTIGVELAPVGRTVAEAQARWEAEPAFAALGASEQAGLFGTMERCHDRVVALAHAGVSDLRCLLPNAIDIHDVIAQLTAMTIGSVDKLVPGAPRTGVPEPPAGWGGRSRFPRPS